MERLHAYEKPIAQLTTVYANSQKLEAPYYKSSDFYLFNVEGESEINVDVCATFLSISKDQLLPSWVLRLSPFEEIQKGAGKGRISKLRMWMRRGLALICPRLENGGLKAGMIVFDDHPVGEVKVWDIDSREVHVISVPKKFEEAYVLDVSWK